MKIALVIACATLGCSSGFEPWPYDLEEQEDAGTTADAARPGRDAQTPNDTAPPPRDTAEPPKCPSGDGKYCGGAAGLDDKTVYDCKAGVFTIVEKCPVQCDKGACTGDALLCENEQWWNTEISYGPWMCDGWWDTDLMVDTKTKIQLRHASRLDHEGVYDWGWMPEFTDQVTGKRFRFLHLQPSARYTTKVGTIYPAGTIVGLSGGDSKETGYPIYSSGEHLCVQTLEKYREVFPAGKDACK